MAMLQNISISNYKSIRELSFEAKRVNVFIGEPNSGKSNLLESLALFSTGVYNYRLFKEIFRFKKTPDLFFDRELGRPIEVRADSVFFSLKFNPPKTFTVEITRRKKALQRFNLVNNGLEPYQPVKDLDFGIRYYRFKSLSRFTDQILGSLYPPFGANLVAVIASNHRLKRSVTDLFAAKGIRLQIDNIESEIAIAKDVDGLLLSHPYESTSETLRRIVFFMAVLETNTNSTLLLDEPEANTFPFYTAYLAERIALDSSNQFFLTTHNPYVLSSIVGKTPSNELAVFVVSMENYATKIKQISIGGLSKILDYGPDAFLNLDKLVEA